MLAMSFLGERWDKFLENSHPETDTGWESSSATQDFVYTEYIQRVRVVWRCGESSGWLPFLC